MKNLRLNSPHGSTGASPHSKKSGEFDAGMQAEIKRAPFGLEVHQ
jgi:hypothetical protein